jgi:integration host factor subunit beta
MPSEDSVDLEPQPRRLTKMILVERVAEAVSLPRHEAAFVVELIFDNIVAALDRGEKVELRGFGSFRTRQRQGRIGRNPRTGTRVEVPAKKIPYFTPSKDLKEKLVPKS